MQELLRGGENISLSLSFFFSVKAAVKFSGVVACRTRLCAAVCLCGYEASEYQA